MEEKRSRPLTRIIGTAIDRASFLALLDLLKDKGTGANEAGVHSGYM